METKLIYESPEVLTIELRKRSMLCQSDGGGNSSMSEIIWSEEGFTQL